MKLMFHAAALSLLLGGLACHQPDVVVRDASGEQNAVSRFSTFGIVLPDPKDVADAGLPPEALPRMAILSVKELEGRGYKPVPPEHADMLITFGPQINEYTTQRVDMDKSGRENEKFDQSQHASGMLTVSFLDAKTKQIVFQRVAETRLLQGGPSEEKMQSAVTKLFADIPPPAQLASSASAVATPAPAPAQAPAAAAAAPDSEEPQATEAAAPKY
jgi:hypothetical protein